MKKRLFGATAVVVAAATTAAFAADLPRGGYAPYTVPAPLGVNSWAGPYLGLNVGYQWGDTTNWSTSPAGAVGGVQGGYLWQNGQFVFGGEADINLSGAEDTFAPYKFINPWFGTVRARGGVAFANVLVYGTAGFAYGGGRVESVAALSENRTHVGWTAGAGVEVAFMPAWSVKAEYLYIDLADRNYSLTGMQHGYESHLLRLGLNYRF